MNELLHRLECQKSKLPPEDHLIIDWGISLVQAKLREQEELQDKMPENNKNLIKYSDYNSFRSTPGWASLNLEDPKDIPILFSLIKVEIEGIVGEAFTKQTKLTIEETIPSLATFLRELCKEENVPDLYEYVIGRCKKFCIESAQHFHTIKPERATIYRMVAEQF